MAPSRFIASRSSRHRTAALALYRSLLRSAQQIPVPGSAQQPATLAHPVAQIIRKRFSKNRTYASFRLIFAGMTAGYKFLGLFAKAQTAGSTEHTQVLTYLNARSAASRTTRATSSSPPSKPSEAPSRPQIPLLTNISQPGQQPKYAPSHPPRPKESLRGERPIPRLASTADGLPFLRMQKPQPTTMASPMLRKLKAYQRYMTGLKYMEEDETPNALLEDEWDHLVEEELRKQKGKSSPPPTSYDSSFAWTAQLSHLWYEWQIEKTWEDWNARGVALQDIVTREKALAEQEALDVNAFSNGPSSPTQPEQHNQLSRRQPNVKFETKLKVEADWFRLTQQARAAEPGGPTPEEIKDPYTARSWRALVDGQHKRLARAVATQIVGRNVGFQASPRAISDVSRR